MGGGGGGYGGGMGGGELSKQGLFNLSKCIAGVTFASTPTSATTSTPLSGTSATWLARFTADLTGDVTPAQRQLALLCVGEVCVCVCMYVCMWVCVCVCVCVCMYVCYTCTETIGTAVCGRGETHTHTQQQLYTLIPSIPSIPSYTL
jgi:hypothetical protein